ncbi:F1F0 ATP synthase subunit e KNAG_0C05440 [Huiozyma naganishii CBS 8797]|uniref:ATP synthase F(0) complex subunit e, mitochondrial n=1 Tax=Huiozyma naganishii (strain ATCC MYA-139 / BCRC 22969 / CBS 8797 / KCTC 17520 / NBRC 10181 / NCYC 3082 / Yp74L-3) TaxID=1071383 RepID=J7RX64_HUIN7|nr:hypothetical protein KNAG_0C05440 [Kazachstania naganishii CBS 8797]CCK69642.1 hypothetical protein KNAG_0C05440 [Kazachstania naganishii CBS 8797]
MSTANVLRYSALGLGVFVGLKNDLGFRSAAKSKKEEEKYQQKVKLVEEARGEWKKLHPPAVVPTSGAAQVNLDDPNFDFGKYIDGVLGSLKST